MDKEQLIKEVQEVEAQKSLLKQHFCNILKQEMPHQDKLDFFLSAPIWLKNEEPYVHRFKAIDVTDSYLCQDRYRTVYTSDLIVWANEHDEEADNFGVTFSREEITAFEKEIMDCNLGSFRFDW